MLKFRFEVIVLCSFFMIYPFLDNGLASESTLTPSMQLTAVQPEIKRIKGVVKRGDTVSKLLKPYLPLKTIYKISRLSATIFPLSRIRKGQPYKITVEEGVLVKFEYEINREDRLVVQKKENQLSVDRVPIEYDIDLEVVSTTITSNLFDAVRKSDEHRGLARKLSDIFAWELDFIRDIQPGDQINVLVEKRYKEGQFSGYGQIQAAFITNNGTLYQAFLHRDSNGITRYYDEKGNSLEKAFLKAPLAFSRISSKFAEKRFHPILKTYRSHSGVDYAAPKGTPIKTVGDGFITEIGYNKSMGNYISIRHSNGYITRYFHMSKFAGKMKKNKRVLQGDVIGYVGMTGYATGTHLCFRMKKNGKSIDPLKHMSLPAKPIKPDEMEAFLSRTRVLTSKMLITQKLAASK